MNRVLNNILKLFFGCFGKAFNIINTSLYMKVYVWYLRRQGVRIEGEPSYISSDSYFDSHDYSQISIGDSTTISCRVMLLTHDYSIARGIQAVNGKNWQSKHTPHTLKPIVIGKNCFIGARVLLLPGTFIGDNCIVGAGAVVKGEIPANSIVVGNPAKIIGHTAEWAKQQISSGNFIQ